MGLVFIDDRNGRNFFTKHEFYLKITREDDCTKWCAPLDEIVKAIKTRDFPKEYVQAICAKVIDAYSKRWIAEESAAEDQTSFWECWDLLDKNEENEALKKQCLARLKIAK